MATDRERLHVAAMLYDEAADFRNLYEKYDNEWTIDLGDVPAAFQDIAHYLGFDGVVRADALFEHLAELIDPVGDETTFVLDRDAEEVYPTRWWKCARCGEETIMMYDEGEPVACPYCGRRVVSSNGLD